MNYTTYNPVTGEIYSNFNTSDTEMAAAYLVDKTWIEGTFESNKYYIDNGQVVEIPTQPQDSNVYNFDYTTKSWIIDLEFSQTKQRQQRNTLLAQIDRVNPVWHASLTTQQQTELAAYRQQLLDVPQQEGFPTTIVWPAQPSWL